MPIEKRDKTTYRKIKGTCPNCGIEQTFTVPSSYTFLVVACIRCKDPKTKKSIDFRLI